MKVIERKWDESSINDLCSPFGSIIDCRDPEWANEDVLSRRVSYLIRTGCNCFICIGTGAEAVHDKIDEIIVAIDPGYSISTTFLEDRPNEELVDLIHGMSVGETKQFVRFLWNTESPD